jgi:transcriptional regulator with XRE-family HTH domain
VDGDKIRQLRKDRGIEVADFAAMIGCTRAHLGNIENKRRRPSADLFDKICEALGIAERQRWRIKAKGGDSSTTSDIAEQVA